MEDEWLEIIGVLTGSAVGILILIILLKTVL